MPGDGVLPGVIGGSVEEAEADAGGGGIDHARAAQGISLPPRKGVHSQVPRVLK